MSNDFYYNTVSESGTAIFSDRGSKFIACVFPVDEISSFKEKLNQLKKEHPKAVHHCFAYRIGFDGNQFRVSDDGEPSGTAGRPILGQIDSKQLTNTAVIVVRYFGGTLLGVPGLIHAYKTAAMEAIQAVPVTRKPILIYYRLEYDYTHMNAVMRLVKQFECLVLKQEAQLFCLLEIGIPKKDLENLLQKFRDIPGIEVNPV